MTNSARRLGIDPDTNAIWFASDDLAQELDADVREVFTEGLRQGYAAAHRKFTELWPDLAASPEALRPWTNR